MRTLWVCAVTGGPQTYVPVHPGAKNLLDLSAAHRKFKISPEEFDEVAKILEHSMNYYHVGKMEQGEVLSAFFAHKKEVTQGYLSITIPEKPC
jgi:hemoglobin